MQNSLKRFVVGGAAVLGLLALVPAAPASAMDQVACGDRTDFLKLSITYGNGFGTNTCFANAGDWAVDFGGVYQVDSGNNKATVNYESGGRYYSETLDPWHGVGFSDPVRVYEIRIW